MTATFQRTQKQRTGTTAQWAASPRVLLAGEIGVLQDAGQPTKFKIGNGVDLWPALSFTGGGGVVGYDHVQSSASSLWVINHNLSRKVTTSVFSVGGSKVIAEVVNVSTNQVQVLFDLPMSGYAIII